MKYDILIVLISEGIKTCDWDMVNANNEVVGTIFNVVTEYEANCMA